MFAVPAVTEMLPLAVESPLNVKGKVVPEVVMVSVPPALIAVDALGVLLPKVVPVNIFALIEPLGAESKGTRGAWI